MADLPTAPILSRSIVVDEIPAAGLRIEVEATPEERDALAALNELPGIPALRATLLLRPEARGGVRVSGEVTARVVQTCVVTLDPFDTDLSEAVDVHFLPDEPLAAFRAARAKRLAGGVEPDETEPEEPDAIIDGRLDVGALVGEHLTLGLDPYPKKPGAEFAGSNPAGDAPDASPFAALKALRPDPQ